jgi:oligopeptide transport system substrate-binding protein
MMSIDEDLLIQAVLKDLNPDIDGIYYPGMDVYNEDLPRIEFDPAAAQEALAQSTYGSADALPAISFYIPAEEQNGTAARLAAAMQEMWREHLGVEVQPRVVATYDEMLESDVQIVIGGEALHYPDAAGIGYFTCDSGANISQFCDPELDATYEAALSTADAAESLELYRQVENTLLERAAFYPLYQVVAFLLVKPRVKNLGLTAMYTFPEFQEVYIGQE